MPASKRRVLRITMSDIATESTNSAADSLKSQSRRLVPRTTPEPLQVFELLELLLLHLPPRDLLLAQRVCHRWQDVIKSSKRIQRALFFLPNGKHVDRKDSEGGPLPNFYVPNPLLAEAFQSHLEFLTLGNGEYRAHPIRSQPAMPGYIIAVALHSSPGREWHKSFRYRHASWRRMLVSQPPVETVSVCMERCVAPDYDDCFREWGHNTEGARMEDILDLEEEDAPDV